MCITGVLHLHMNYIVRHQKHNTCLTHVSRYTHVAHKLLKFEQCFKYDWMIFLCSDFM